MVLVNQELIALSDEVWQRTCRRLDGLTDDEYLWEPAPGAGRSGRGPTARWRADWPLPRPEPEPFTTIAWRLWHLIDMYGEDRAPQLAGPRAPRGPDRPGRPGRRTAAHRTPGARPAGRGPTLAGMPTWPSHPRRASAAGSAPSAAGTATGTRAAYVLHMLDEFIHHGAEIALLRDLWRWQHHSAWASTAERAMRGDLSVLDGLADLGPDASTELLGVAAVLRPVGARHRPRRGRGGPARPGDDPPAPRRLGGRGRGGGAAGRPRRRSHVRDPQFHATPGQWAEFVRHPDIAAWLRRHETGRPPGQDRSGPAGETEPVEAGGRPLHPPA